MRNWRPSLTNSRGISRSSFAWSIVAVFVRFVRSLNVLFVMCVEGEMSRDGGQLAEYPLHMAEKNRGLNSNFEPLSLLLSVSLF